MSRDASTAVPQPEGLDPLSSKPNAVYNLEQPSTFWRIASKQTIFGVAALCRGFLYGLNTTEVSGLPRFLELLKSRENASERQRGLITVSNHICVMDDPIIWGTLPLSFYFSQASSNFRFGLGSHDICFQGTLLSHFFTLGQVLPAHRLAHSPWGGPTQPSVLEAIRLLSPIRANTLTTNHQPPTPPTASPSWPSSPIDPFTDPSALQSLAGPHFRSSSTDPRSYHAPSRYASNQFSWIHIFPEGMIHQSPDYHMRYFKWGIARLILEPPVCPDVVPMWIEGTDQVMHESRKWPRGVPRAGKKVSVTFGEKVDTERRFADLRRRWREMRDREVVRSRKEAARQKGKEVVMLERQPDYDGADLGHLPFERPWEVKEVRELWIETTKRVREEVLNLRKQRGWPDEDPKSSAAETWIREGPKREGKMEDGTWVGDT
jgi:monolysocardiolipin acyltransferase